MSSNSRFEHEISSEKWTVKSVRALSDNFMYLIVDLQNKTCAAIDVVEPEKVLKAAESIGCSISHVLTTHSHWDHDGGNVAISKKLPDSVPIIGGKRDGAKAVTREVADGETVKMGDLDIKVLATPFHTPGHVCYYVEHDNHRAVFTGDTLFVAGCGNLNAGTKSQLHHAFKVLGALPKDTLIYCGHEYTVANLTYASSVEPENGILASKLAWAKSKREDDKDTIPSTIEEEYQTSPFLKAAFGLSKSIADISGIPAEKTDDQILWVRRDKSSGQWKNRL